MVKWVLDHPTGILTIDYRDGWHGGHTVEYFKHNPTDSVFQTKDVEKINIKDKIGYIRVTYYSGGYLRVISCKVVVFSGLIDLSKLYRAVHQFNLPLCKYESLIISILSATRTGDIPWEIWKLIGEYL